MKRRRTRTPGVSFFAFQDIITAVVGIFILITLILVLELAERVEKATAGPSDGENIEPILASIEIQKQEVQSLREQYAERKEQSLSGVEVNTFNRTEKITELRSKVTNVQAKQKNLDQQVRELGNAIDAANIAQRELKRTHEELESQRKLARELEEKSELLKRQASRLSGDKTEIYRDTLDDGRYLTLLTLVADELTIRDAQSKNVMRQKGPSRVEQFTQWLTTQNVTSKHFMILIEPGGSLDLVKVRQILDQERARYGYTVVGDNHGVRLGFEVEADLGKDVP